MAGIVETHVGPVEFTIMEDDAPCPDDPFCIQEPGTLEFFVQQNAPDVFEIDVLDYDGCMYWAQEGMGFEYWVEYYIGKADLREGVTYLVTEAEVTFYRGDGWTTDDDEDWDFQLTHRVRWATYIKTKLRNLWWRSVGYRIAERKRKAKQ